jgi:hypothetical protein
MEWWSGSTRHRCASNLPIDDKERLRDIEAEWRAL